MSGTEEGAEPGPADDVPSWSKLLIDFTQNTSLHGWHFITEARTYILRRLIWFVLVGSTFGVYVYYAQQRIGYFLQYEKNVNVEIAYPPTMPFPAITFCNQNQYKITELADNNWYYIITSLMSNGSTTAGSTSCPAGEFLCDSGTCISSSKLCDVFPDCNDGSDEESTICVAPDYCCPLLVINSSSADVAAELPDIVGFSFYIQPSTYSPYTFQGRDRPFYVREKKGNFTDDIYLYYDSHSDRWTIGSIFGAHSTQNLSWTVNPTQNPQDITSNWTIRATSREAPLNITCGTRYAEVLVQPSIESVEGVSMETLIATTAHKRGDFIISCKWKGNDCAEDAITESWTDMGVCWQFNDTHDMEIDQSGPGNGLQLNLNVEYYEYSGSDGIGIKILMHEVDNVALVKERGTAVSPGLYSFVSVESTKVSSAEPPWGECDEQPLYYYTFYSVATCTAECQAKLVMDQCGCIAPFQPNISGSFPVCDVMTYVNCTEDYLNYIAANQTMCNSEDCTSPCEETSYVPTTSFATFFGNPLGDSITSRQTQLLADVENATETAQRVVSEKIWSTQRLFHDVSVSLITLQRWSTLTLANMADEQGKMLNIGGRVTSDSAMFRDVLADARDNIADHLELPLVDYISEFSSRLVARFLEVYNDVNYTLTQHQALTNEYDRLLLQSAQNQTIWHGWHEVKAVLLLMKEERLDLLRRDIQAVSSTSPLVFDQSRMTSFIPYIGGPCELCMNAAGEGLLDIIKGHLLVELQIQSEFTTIEGQLNVLYTDYLENAMFVYQADANEVRDEMDNISNRMLGLQNTLTNELDLVKEAKKFVDNTLEYVWRQRCQSETQNVFGSYTTISSQVDGLLGEVYTFTTNKNDQWLQYKQQYYDKSMELKQVGYHYDFYEILAYVTRKEIRLEMALSQRKQVIYNVRDHVGQVGYLMYSSLTSGWLSQNSALWEEFQAVTPNADDPQDVLIETADGHMVPTPNYTLVLSELEVDFWEELQLNLDAVMQNLEAQMLTFDSFITTSQTYMDDYISSLELTDQFYEQNILQVEVFFKELTQQSVTQNPAYTVENLLSEIGGFMGLLLGASVISLAEFLDLFLYNSFRKAHQKVKQRNRTDVRPTPELANQNGGARWPKENY